MGSICLFFVDFRRFIIRVLRRPRTLLVHAFRPPASMLRRHPFHTLFIHFLKCKKKQAMGEWKAPLSLRVRQALRAGLEQYAAQEKRTLGNVGELILEWAFQQLLAAGSTERLLKCSIRLGVRKSKRR